MDTSTQAPVLVPAGEDRFGEQRGLGVSSLRFKMSGADSSDLFVVQNEFHQPGGPARHLHYSQDEWFYAVEGEFAMEVGGERFTLKAGDSVFAPRHVPHVWACTSLAGGRMLVTFAPAGQMEAFFQEVTKADAMPPQDPALWRAYGMELLGPPLPLGAK